MRSNRNGGGLSFSHHTESSFIDENKRTGGVAVIVFMIKPRRALPFLLFLLHRLVKSAAKRQMHHASLWDWIFLLAGTGPYMHVLFFGRNLPWWIFLIIGAIVIQRVEKT